MSDIFQYGVASGDPLCDRVILWTRVSREMQVQWEIAADPNFERVLFSGIKTAIPERDFTIHADPAPLEPVTVYYYRFHADGAWRGGAVVHKVIAGYTGTTPRHVYVCGRYRQSRDAHPEPHQGNWHAHSDRSIHT